MKSLMQWEYIQTRETGEKEDLGIKNQFGRISIAGFSKKQDANTLGSLLALLIIKNRTKDAHFVRNGESGADLRQITVYTRKLQRSGLLYVNRTNMKYSRNRN